VLGQVAGLSARHQRSVPSQLQLAGAASFAFFFSPKGAGLDLTLARHTRRAEWQPASFLHQRERSAHLILQRGYIGPDRFAESKKNRRDCVSLAEDALEITHEQYPKAAP
jgi:hypothetical protein